MALTVCTLILSVCLIITAIRYKKAKYFLIAGILSIVQIVANTARFYTVNISVPDTILFLVDKLSILMLALALFYAVAKENKNAAHSN